jgi:hypothetical protein
MYTVARVLLTSTAMTQTAIADAAKLTQSRVSKTLAVLKGAGHTHRGAGGWTVTDWQALADWWLARYPGPGGITTHWYSLDSLADQVETAAGAYQASHPGSDIRLSGDSAADLLAPWRRPARTVLYVTRPLNLAGHGFVAAAGLADATLSVTLPVDPGVWLATPLPAGMHAPVPVTDGLQVVYDVLDAGGSDAVEAGQRLRDVLQDTWSRRQ